jgi:hypothetical protein
MNEGRQLERTEVDGVPAYFVRDWNRYSGVLLFRTGRADESFPRGGVTHLVEHLALHSLGSRQQFEFNGFVAGLVTAFVATGEPEQVSDFLTGVSQGLSDLPLDRIRDETRVLRTEAASRVLGPVETLLNLRYGATGPALCAYPELFLLSPDPEYVRSWASERFTSGNAALCFTGRPPANLRLPLPPGRRIATRPLTPIANVRYPGWAIGNPGGVATSFVGPREDWLAVPLEFAAGRLRNRLRYERGLTYEVAIDYDPVTTDLAHGALWATCLPEQAAAVRDGIVGVIEELATDGPTDEELADARKNYRRSAEDPESSAHQLMAAATNELLGYPVKSLADLSREMDALERPEISRRFAAAMETALLVIPPNCPSPESKFRPYPGWSETIVSGKTFRRGEMSFPWSKGPRLVVGTDGVSFVTHDKHAITVAYATCTTVVYTTGLLEMYGDDGFRLAVHPGHWWNGLEATRLILRAVPPSRVVRVLEPDGAS